MNCPKFQQFELGEIDEHVFNEHVKTCPSCQTLVDEDNKLLELAKTLKLSIQAPKLWDRIEEQLQSEKEKFQRQVHRTHWPNNYLLKIAAILILVVGISIFIGKIHHRKEQGLLARSVLEKVEKQERAYTEAIAELEKAVQPKFVSLDLELQFLYRDRLETIDQQIAQCKKALALNPAHAHIRKYLMMALKDKKETLIEIMNIGGNNV